MNAADAYLTLNLLPEIGSGRANQLLRRLGDPVAILRASTRQLAETPGISPRLAEIIAGWRDHCDPEAEKRLAARAGVEIVCRDHAAYPELLREIADPPLLLYLRGNLEAISRLSRSLALVGTRGPTNYGARVARHLAEAAVYDGWSVVSGLARGIDTVAHRAAVEADGCTVAVLGGGLAQIYPPENRELAREICRQGLLISELPMRMKPTRLTFPMRNRLIAGLSQGTVVVEAGTRSGALITANLAMEQNRRVFAVPGQVDSPQSRGCHSLLKDGAVLVERFEDIAVEFSFGQPFPGIAQTAKPTERQMAEVADAATAPPPPPAAASLSELESRLLELLGRDEMQIDDLIAQSGEPAHLVLATLIQLEMRHLVEQMPGKRVALR